MYRHKSLDGLRGIAAVCVTLMHFPINNSITQSIFIKNSYLFVDLFFVISGYVISLNLHKQHSFVTFIKSRLLRLLPLYYVTLSFAVLLEFILYVYPGLSTRKAFTEVTSIDSLISEVFLYHGLPFVGNSSFNPPNWSISVEIILYVTAGMLYFTTTKLNAQLTLCLFFIIFGNMMLYNQYWNDAHDLALFRGMAGFGTGALIFHIKKYFTSKNDKVVGFLTTLYAFFIILYVYSDGAQKIFEISILFPSIVFGILVYLFVLNFNNVIFSAIFENKIVLWFGAISYPLYLIHYFIGHRLDDVCAITKYGNCNMNVELLLLGYFIVSVVAAHTLLVILNPKHARR